MHIIVAGSRDFNDWERLCRILDKEVKPGDTIVSGAARGADQMGEQYANAHNIPVLRMPAHWTLYGKSAGYRRNEAMADRAQKAIVFWDGQSRGSKHMIDIAHARGLEVLIVRTDRKEGNLS